MEQDMTKDEALDKALEALESMAHGQDLYELEERAITAIKQARSAPVPLTDEQIADIQTAANLNWVNLNCREHRDAFVRAIEAAHGITKGQP